MSGDFKIKQTGFYKVNNNLRNTLLCLIAYHILYVTGKSLCGLRLLMTSF